MKFGKILYLKGTQTSFYMYVWVLLRFKEIKLKQNIKIPNFSNSMKFIKFNVDYKMTTWNISLFKFFPTIEDTSKQV